MRSGQFYAVLIVDRQGAMCALHQPVGVWGLVGLVTEGLQYIQYSGSESGKL